MGKSLNLNATCTFLENVIALEGKYSRIIKPVICPFTNCVMDLFIHSGNFVLYVRLNDKVSIFSPSPVDHILYYYQDSGHISSTIYGRDEKSSIIYDLLCMLYLDLDSNF